jgi:hypothetical protein
MAKKTKDTTVSTTKKEVKAKAPVDPVATKNLVRLLNILALLLAIAAFLLQFLAVISHHWKWQVTGLRPLISPDSRPSGINVYNDSRIDQRYGLYSRDVKLYANNDEQLDVWTSTRFPRIDDGDDNFHHCLSQTSSLRGALLTCSNRVVSLGQCHCRRYPYWNAVIVFEILALILLGLVVFVCALLTTQYHGLLKPIGVVLAFLAFLFLLIGLILILSYLKRETRSIADTYPHIFQRIVDKVGHHHQHHQTVLRRAVRRQTHETYQGYDLIPPNQRYYNLSHYLQLTDRNDWVLLPVSNLQPIGSYIPRSQQAQPVQVATTERTITGAPLYNHYGPLIGYDQVYDNTRAGIGWSTVLSILAMILSLLLPLILAFSFLKGKQLGPVGKTETITTTTTTLTTQLLPSPQEVNAETVPLSRPIAVEYDTRHPIEEKVLITQTNRQTPYDNHGGRNEHPTATTTQTYRT